MGAIEIQVFVSLVVILGAAFVALICDFLKGNNEQLRETNIEMRVRQDEREKREALVQEVQRQTLEVVAQVQQAVGQRTAVPAAAAHQGAAAEASRRAAGTASRDGLASYGRQEEVRGGRGRRSRREAAEAAGAEWQVKAAGEQTPAAWAQDLFLRRYPHGELPHERPVGEAARVQPAGDLAVQGGAQPVLQPDVQVALEQAHSERVGPMAAGIPIGLPAVSARTETYGQMSHALSPAGTREALIPSVAWGEPDPVAAETKAASMPEPEEFAREFAPETAPEFARENEAPAGVAGVADLRLEPLPVQALSHTTSAPIVTLSEGGIPPSTATISPVGPIPATQVELPSAPAASVLAILGTPGLSVNAGADAEVPRSGLQVEAAAAIAAEAPVAVSDEGLTKSDGEAVRAGLEESELAANVVRIRVLREDDLLPEAGTGEVPASEPEKIQAAVIAEELPEVGAGAEVVAEAPAVPSEPVVAVSVPEAAEAPSATPEALSESGAVEAAERVLMLPEPVAEVAAPDEVPEPAAARSNVVEMPTGQVRGQEAEQPARGELVVPGGFHEPQVLARLLEEDADFRGLVFVVSLVDYVRLLADQGKPGMEQLMGSISRTVVSMTREQDFGCRIAEDEFVMLFVRETGAAAKRRIQLISERLWDFQLRSLGSISIMFTWGAIESNGKSLAQALDSARGQMLETRQSRRAQASGTGRFRRAAND